MVVACVRLSFALKTEFSFVWLLSTRAPCLLPLSYCELGVWKRSSPPSVLRGWPQRASDPCCPLSSAGGSRWRSCGGTLHGTGASPWRVHHRAAHWASPLPAARVLEVSGREGLPRSRALRQGRHQHSRQRVPGGEVRTVFKVMGDTLVCIWGTRWFPSLPVCDVPLLFFCRHGWNLTVLPNNTGSILRHLGAVPGKPGVAAVFVVFKRKSGVGRGRGRENTPSRLPA